MIRLHAGRCVRSSMALPSAVHAARSATAAWGRAGHTSGMGMGVAAAHRTSGRCDLARATSGAGARLLHCAVAASASAVSPVAAPAVATSTSTGASACASASIHPLPLPSQQERWNTLRTVAARLLTEPDGGADTAGAPHAPTVEWLVLPSLRAQASPNSALHAAQRALAEEVGEALTAEEEAQRDEAAAAGAVVDGDLDDTSRRMLTSVQHLEPHLHQQAIILQPHVAAMWRRLNRWDRSFQRRSAQRANAAPIDSAADGDDGSAMPGSIGWSTRGLFLDGPNGISKTSSLYALTCLARAHGWMAVHIADADAWVGQMHTAASSRMLVQAVYEAAAACVLPETATWSAPHSLLQLPLNPALDYTSTLVEQGIGSFGELLTLALELEDGTEEAELSVECIMAQLHSITEVPVLIAVDGFDALTQRCLQQPGANTSAEEEDALIAPITTSPFSYMNYHRAPAFRGCFVVSGESYALVQQSHPELMERLPSRFDDEEDEDEQGAAAASAAAPKRSEQPVDPIHVWPLPPLADAAACREYLRAKLRADPHLASSFLLAPSLPSWSFIFHQLTSGHFSLLNSLLQLPAVARPTFVPPATLRAEVTALTCAANLDTYESLFPSSRVQQRNLAAFFLHHLPVGFYRDFLRNEGRPGGGGRLGPDRSGAASAGAHARDYNLVSVNEADSHSMVQWIRRLVADDAQVDDQMRRALVQDSSAWGMLTAELPWEALSTPQLHLVQQSKLEAFLQVIAMVLLLRNSTHGSNVRCTPLAHSGPHTPAAVADSVLSFPITSINHWSSSLDPALLDARDMSSNSLQCQWALTSAVTDASQACGLAPAEHLTRLVHVRRDADADAAQPGEIKLFMPVLDPALLQLLLAAPTGAAGPGTPAEAGAPSASSSSPSHLVHTLHLHLLSEILQALQVCVGPACQVKARAADGSLHSWTDVESMVDALQAGMLNDADLPLRPDTNVTAIVALPLDEPTDKSAAAVAMPTLRVVWVSPHAPTAAGAAATDASAPASLRFRPLFDFASAIIGSDVATLLSVPQSDLQRIRWR